MKATGVTLEATAEKKLAMMRLYHFAQNLRGGLSQFLKTVEVHPDRIYLEPWSAGWAEGFLRTCDKLRSTSEWVEVDPDQGRRHHGPTAFRSYRGRLPHRFMGDQWILHVAPGEARPGYELPIFNVASQLHRIEFDIDDESPVDVAGMVGHWITVFGHRRKGTQTDPRNQVEVLLANGIKV